MAYFIVWLLLSALVAAYAHSKGHSAGWFLILSLLLSPLIGLLVAVLSSTNQAGIDARQLRDGSMQKCPACAELVKRDATKCRYCGSALTPAPPATAPTRPTRPPRTPEQIRRDRTRLVTMSAGFAALLALAVWLTQHPDLFGQPGQPQSRNAALVITFHRAPNGQTTATSDTDRTDCSFELNDGRAQRLPAMKARQPITVPAISTEPKVTCGNTAARVYWIQDR